MGYWGKLSLRSQTLIYVSVSLLVILALFGYAGSRIVGGSLENSLEERKVMAVMAASFLDEILQLNISQLRDLAESPKVVNDWNDRDAERLLLKQAFTELKAIAYNIYLTDSRGVVLLTEPYSVFWDKRNLADSSAVAEVLGGKDLSVTGVDWAPGDNRPIVVIAMPVKDTSGKLIGVIGGTMDLTAAKFKDLIEPMTIGRTGHSQLVDGKGIVLASTALDERFSKSDHSNQFAELVRKNQPAVANCHNCHESGSNRSKSSEILIFAPLKTVPWGIAIRQSEEEAFAASYNLRNSIAGLGAGSMGIALLLTWMMAGRLVGRIRGLTGAANRIASGDLDSPVHVLGGDEIGVLGRTFDDMRVRINASQREIETWNEELEGKVEARTRELSSLFEASKILTSSFEIDAVMKSIVVKCVEIVTPADAGALLLYDPGLGRLVVKASTGFGRDLLAMSNLLPGEGIPGTVFASGSWRVYSSPAQVAEASKEEPQTEGGERRRHIRAFAAESVMAVPLVSKGNPIGVLTLVGYQSGNSFSESDLRLVESLCDQISIAVENSNLIKEADGIRAIQQADRLKSEFIANISHELRTPLASIKGYTSTLLRTDASWDQDSQLEFLRIVDEESDKLRELIDNLLEISKMGAGSIRIYPEPVLLQRIASKVIEQARGRTDKHCFALDFSNGFPVVEADVRRVEQILQNLVENAVKYSPAGGNIRIEGKAEASRVVIMVTDEGIGIPSDEIDRVFQRFYRVDNPTTRQTSGTGLGLSIVKWIVEAHGGEIWVESRTGAGSSFCFSLPYNSEIVVEVI